MKISATSVESNVVVSDDVVHESRERSANSSGRHSEIARLWSVIILPFLLIRGVLLVVGLVTTYYIEPLVSRLQPIHLDGQSTHFPEMLWLMWTHFDSGFYLSIARDGYGGPEALHGMSSWAFFPLYPVLMRLVVLPFPVTDTLLRIVGVLLANVAAMVALIYLYKLTEHEFNAQIGARAVLYLALFPMSFYLSALYPESLFLALTLGSVYYARQKKWWLAGLLGGLATLTRPQGVLLSVVVGWEYWQALAEQFAPLQRQDQGVLAFLRDWLRSRFLGLWRSLRSWRTWAGIAALLEIPLGLGIFCLYGKWRTGTFFPFQVVEKYWGRTFKSPLRLLIDTFRTPVAPSPYDWNFYALGVLAICIFILMLIPIFRKLPAVYGIFATLFVLMPLMTGATNSIARYYMEVFPVFMVVAWWSSQGDEEQRTQRHSLLVASFALLLALGMLLFTLGVYSMS